MTDDWIPLLRAGKRPRTLRVGSTEVRIGKRYLRQLAKNLNGQVLRRYVPALPEGDYGRPVYGWLRAARVVATADGGAVLEARLEPTRIGAAEVAADEYRYVAPQWYRDYRDAEIGEHYGPTLTAVALTRQPTFPAQPRIDAMLTRAEHREVNDG